MSTGNVIQVVGWHNGTNCGSDYLKRYQKTWVGDDYAPGELRSTPHFYTMTKNVLYRGIGTKYPGRPYASSELTQKCLGGPSFLQADWTSSDENKLLGKLFEKIRGHDFHAGNFAGTAGQTAALIGDSARKLAAGIKSLKNGSLVPEIVKALRSGNSSSGICIRNPRYPACRKRGKDKNLGGGVDALSSRWLEAAYGWMPLLDDAYAGANALAQLQVGSQRRTFTATHKAQPKEESFSSIYEVGATHGKATRKVRISYTISAELNPLDSLSLVNPAEIAWELLPWSFVIDWFLPIGLWMNNQTFANRVSGSGYRTEITEWKGKSWSNRPDIYLGEECTHRIYTLTRTLIAPGNLKVPFVSFKNPFSGWKRGANQIALLGQLLTR